jgi:hypothetical protein
VTKKSSPEANTNMNEIKRKLIPGKL